MTLKSQNPTYVIGHLNPDTDAICAAIGQAEYLRQAEGVDAVPIRCGEIPTRVKWVLEQAQMETPALVEDVRTTAELICEKEYVSVDEGDTFYSVYRAMEKSEVKSIPVVNSAGEIRGILRFTDLMKLLMPVEMETMQGIKVVHASQQNIRRTLRGESVGVELTDEEQALIMFVGASSRESTIEGLEKNKEQGLTEKQVVICGDRRDIQMAAVCTGVKLLIVTGGYKVSEDVIAEAKAQGVAIILSRYDTAATVQLVRCSRAVKNALGEDFLCVNAEDAVSDIRQALGAAPQDVFPVVAKGTRKLVGVFRKADLVDPPKTKLVLVDHNEFAQAVKGVEESNLLEVIDHHRLGGDIVSRDPIRFLNEPVGSASTLVARQFRLMDVPLSKEVALCLCAGLISDTLNLTSPTTTDVDKEILAWLTAIAGVDATQFTNDFFASGSLLLKGTPEQIIGTDRKEFRESGKFISISQIEEMNLDTFAEREQEIRQALIELMQSKGYEIVLCAVTDITKHHSKIIALGDDAVIHALPFERISENVLDAAGVVSRKKQIFPAVSTAIQEAAVTSMETL